MISILNIDRKTIPCVLRVGETLTIPNELYNEYNRIIEKLGDARKSEW